MKLIAALLGLGLLAACTCPTVDPDIAALQRHYAEVGERMIVTANRVEQKNPSRSTTPSLSSTNRPATR